MVSDIDDASQYTGWGVHRRRWRMSVIAEISVDSSDFILGRLLQRVEGIAIEIEKVIPTGSAAIPYFWVVGDDEERFEEMLRTEEELSTFEAVDELDGRTLYRATWDPGIDTFLDAVTNGEPVLMEAGGDDSTWEFRLRFPDSHSLSEFHTALREAGIDFEVVRLFNPIEPSLVEDWGLTDPQRELIEHAYDRGYFDVPRRVTLVELAEDLGVSDQSVNERLRRGLHSLIRASVVSERSSSD